MLLFYFTPNLVNLVFVFKTIEIIQNFIKNMPLGEQDPCLPSVDALEACMKAHNFQDEKCKKILTDLQRCCEKFKDESLLCRGFELVTRFLTLPDGK